jgi:hypothetical protein
MAKSTTNTSYINGLFVTEKEGQYGKYLSVGITEEGLEALKALEPSASGFRNITLSPQKNDPTKYSAKPYVPKSKGGDDDTLPF